tara:strand:- start:4102 stop:4680 length:579 start_codon:yes stop_codon:yes gene_type:complete
MELEQNSKGMRSTQIAEFDYQNRECGTCSMCCQGYLYGEAYNAPFFPNHPCHYWDPEGGTRGCGGCSIHQDRPAICVQFNCLWKQTKQMPMWMKPNNSKVLVYTREWKDSTGEFLRPGESLQWISAVECGQQMDSNVLSWLIQQARYSNWNLHYQLKGQDHYLGSEQFHQFVDSSKELQQDILYNGQQNPIK